MRKRFNFKFIEKRKFFITLSVVLMLASILSTFIFGAELDIQFKGGTIITYIYDGEINQAQFNEAVSNALGGAGGFNITTGTDFSSGRNNIQISLTSNEGLTSDRQFELTHALTTQFAGNNLELLESADVSPSAGREFFLKCLVAVAFSSLALIVYIALRFKHIGGWIAGLCAVAALLHDCVIVYGAFIVFGMSINANFMAVILTILGYSINNTIVIYDRIRENDGLHRKTKSRADIINESINQSLTRSINTSLTTAVAMIVVTAVAIVYGVGSIVSFSLPMVVGIVAGTYSSICFTCSLWYVIGEKKGKAVKKTKAA
ncbi:MAG: protein translocase subunit SecF [Oscillospiraceae bacterium]|nr:protein translocase subunit SecF [Oscillospiraceae bacterium]